jgi:hypothetical protein
VLLILDPFVRLHRIDENASAEVAPLLAYLRDLQRTYKVAVVVVHHAKKGAGKARDGQALRGSSEFHAWGDSNLYLRRRGERLFLAAEHRAAESISGIAISLTGGPDSLALAIADAEHGEPAEPSRTPTAAERVVEALRSAGVGTAVGLTALRRLCKMRTQTLGEAIGELMREGRLEKTRAGYLLRSGSSNDSWTSAGGHP